MNRAVWAIVYQVERANQARYLEWFHQVHVAEKLARPGYNWAAHYVEHGHEDQDSPQYIALFGGTDTRVFFDPSPAQLKPRQDELTREMMGYRVNAKALILGQEWAQQNQSHDDGVVHAPSIRFMACQMAAGKDEGFAAWCAQEYFPELGVTPGCIQARKYCATSGPARHVVIEEYDSATACADAPREALDSTWHEDLSQSVSVPIPFRPASERLWPPPGA